MLTKKSAAYGNVTRMVRFQAASAHVSTHVCIFRLAMPKVCKKTYRKTFQPNIVHFPLPSSCTAFSQALTVNWSYFADVSETIAPDGPRDPIRLTGPKYWVPGKWPGSISAALSCLVYFPEQWLVMEARNWATFSKQQASANLKVLW